MYGCPRDIIFRLLGIPDPNYLISITKYLHCLKSHPWDSFLYGIKSSQVILVVRNLLASAGDGRDTGLIPGWGRSPGEGHGNPLQCSKRASQVAQVKKNQETWVQPLGRDDPWRRAWQPTPGFLPESHGQRSWVGYSPWGCKKLWLSEDLTHKDMTEWLTFSLS